MADSVISDEEIGTWLAEISSRPANVKGVKFLDIVCNLVSAQSCIEAAFQRNVDKIAKSEATPIKIDKKDGNCV